MAGNHRQVCKVWGRLKQVQLQSDFEDYLLEMGVSGLVVHNSQFKPKR